MYDHSFYIFILVFRNYLLSNIVILISTHIYLFIFSKFYYYFIFSDIKFFSCIPLYDFRRFISNITCSCNIADKRDILYMKIRSYKIAILLLWLELLANYLEFKLEIYNVFIPTLFIKL